MPVEISRELRGATHSVWSSDHDPVVDAVHVDIFLRLVGAQSKWILLQKESVLPGRGCEWDLLRLLFPVGLFGTLRRLVRWFGAMQLVQNCDERRDWIYSFCPEYHVEPFQLEALRPCPKRPFKHCPGTFRTAKDYFHQYADCLLVCLSWDFVIFWFVAG